MGREEELGRGLERGFVLVVPGDLAGEAADEVDDVLLLFWGW